MIDRPDADALRTVIVDVRAEDATPSYFVRIADNLERMLERQNLLGPAQQQHARESLAGFLGNDMSVDELMEQLDRGLRSGDIAPTSALRSVLMSDVCRRLDIAQPDYR